MTFTKLSLEELKDAAAEHGFGEKQEARFAMVDLEAEDTGLAHIKVKPNQRQPFAHKHESAEEIYVVIAGSGRVKLDDEIVELKRLDAIRVSPQVTRGFEAGPDGLEFLVFGSHHSGDAEIISDHW